MGPDALSLRPVAWSDDVAAHLARAPADGPLRLVGPDYYERQAAAGRLELTGVFAAGDLVGVLALRVERFDLGRELVIVAAGGRLPGVDLTATVLPALERVAAERGVQSIRFHTRRLGLLRKAARHGYCLSEFVMVKGAGNGLVQ